jgi:N-methylhydantoinase A
MKRLVPPGPGVTRLGADVGGTFTDVVAIDSNGVVHIGKTLTTPGEEHRGVLDSIAQSGIGVAGIDVLVHGTTLVINALTERSDRCVALVTTAGFRDVHLMGRSSRPQDTNIFYHRDEPLIPRHRIFEIGERMLASGESLRKPEAKDIVEVAARLADIGTEAVGVAFLNSYAHPAHEEDVAEALRAALPGVFVTTSSSISRTWREYERFTTAAANAYVGPTADHYLKQIETSLAERGFNGTFALLDSNGGALTPATGRRFPVRLVESGPVGGALAARDLVAELGLDSAVSFDMGGTTAKSTIIENGTFTSTDLYWPVGYDTGFPVQTPCVDIIEIGAGGGSIAWVDDGGRLRVGPRSAGAAPGPACYGNGGTALTVTDANVFCGRLPVDFFLASITVSGELAAEATSRLARQLNLTDLRLATGVIEIANMLMADVVRQQTVVRGRNPHRTALVGFGGAGPIHACEVAAAASVPRVLIPISPGHFSAFGMLKADLRYDATIVVQGLVDDADTFGLSGRLRNLGRELSQVLASGETIPAPDDLHYQVGFALRYRGQAHTLHIDLPRPGMTIQQADLQILRDAFEDEHGRRFGHTHAGAAVEIVSVDLAVHRPLPQARVRGTKPSASLGTGTGKVHFGQGAAVTTEIVPRSDLVVGSDFEGPLIAYEIGTCTLIPPGARGTVLPGGVLDIDVSRMRSDQ